MVLLLLFIGCLIAMSLFYGFRGYKGLDFIIEINMFSSPYHHFGVSFFGDEYNDEYMVERLDIGLIVINIVLVFYKPKK